MTECGLLMDDYVVELQDQPIYTAEGFYISFAKYITTPTNKATTPRPVSSTWIDTDFTTNSSKLLFGSSIKNITDFLDDISFYETLSPLIARTGATTYRNRVARSRGVFGAMLRYWPAATNTIYSGESLAVMENKMTIGSAAGTFTLDASTATNCAATISGASTDGATFDANFDYSLRVCIGTGVPEWKLFRDWAKAIDSGFIWDGAKTNPVIVTTDITEAATGWTDFYDILNDNGYFATDITSAIDADGNWAPASDTDFDWMMVYMPLMTYTAMTSYLPTMPTNQSADASMATGVGQCLTREVGQSNYSSRLSNVFQTGSGNEFPADFTT